MPNNYDDEALARALQEEYEREYRRRSMQQHLETGSNDAPSRRTNPIIAGATAPIQVPPPFAVSSQRGRSYYDDELPIDNSSNVIGSHRGTAASSSSPPFAMAEDVFGSIEISDAAYARQLEQQELAELEIRRSQRKKHLQQQRDVYRSSQQQSQNPEAKAGRNRSNDSDFHAPQGRIVSTPQTTSSRNKSINQSKLVPPPSVSVNTSRPSTLQENTNSNYNPRPQYSRNNSLSSSFNSTDNHPTDPYYESSNRDNRNRDSRRGNTMIPMAANATTLYADEEYARRLEQELRDEELARQQFMEEQIRQSSIAAQAMSNNNNSRRSRSSRTASGSRRGCRRCISCILSLVLVCGATALFLYFFLGVDEVGDFDKFKEEDPFNSANRSEANLWRTNGKSGLEIVLVNALDTDWHNFFYTAVDDWNSGTPDTLTLLTETAEPDSVCEAIDGKIKVCNGNYGATNWRGINKILLENNWIYSSAARMNEYYTSSNDDSQRQYTMCHEIGHGFGLPHTDENFFNKDLGNCMDYTNKPEVNMQPAYANFKFLAELYGTVDGSPVPTDDNVSVESSSAVNQTEAPVPEENDNWKDKIKNFFGNRRRLSPLPPDIVNALADIDTMVDNQLYSSEDHGWRKLHENEFGHAYEIDLGSGYSVQVHALKA